MKLYAGFIFIMVMSLLASCGPDARYPIDEHPVVKIDTRLFGKWVITEKKGDAMQVDSDIVYTVSKQSDYEYLVSIRVKDNDGYKEDKTTAYLSKVDHEPFVNVYIKDNSGGYIFIKILDIDADRVTATSLADTMTVTSAAQVRALITKNIKNPGFFKDTVEFNRVK